MRTIRVSPCKLEQRARLLCNRILRSTDSLPVRERELLPHAECKAHCEASLIARNISRGIAERRREMHFTVKPLRSWSLQMGCRDPAVWKSREYLQRNFKYRRKSWPIFLELGQILNMRGSLVVINYILATPSCWFMALLFFVMWWFSLKKNPANFRSHKNSSKSLRFLRLLKWFLFYELQMIRVQMMKVLLKKNGLACYLLFNFSICSPR